MGVGQFLSDLYDTAIGSLAGARAAETQIGEASERVEDLLDSLETWSLESVMRVLVVSDPLTLVGREDAAALYRGVASAVVEHAEASGDSSARGFRRGLEVGMDGLPGEVRVFIKRGALREVPKYLERLAVRAGRG